VFFRFCYTSEWISKDPTVEVELGKITDSEIKSITKKELKKILAACDEDPDKQHPSRLRAFLLITGQLHRLKTSLWDRFVTGNNGLEAALK
jgi:site-specific recombinase XerD